MPAIRAVLAAAMVLAAMTLPGATAESAQQEAALLRSFDGRWSGSGYLRPAPGSPPQQITCSLAGNGRTGRLDLAGQCTGPVKAKMWVNLRWSAGVGSYLGTLQGGAETGVAKLSGKLRGNTIDFQVTGERGVGRLLVTLESADEVRLVGTGKDLETGREVTLVDVSLQRQSPLGGAFPLSADPGELPSR